MPGATTDGTQQSIEKGRNKIFWFLVGNPQQVASSRIQGLRIHEKLCALGFNSILAYTPLHIEEELPFDKSKESELSELFAAGDLVVLQKIKNPINLPFLDFLRKNNVRLILVDCDLPVSTDIGRICDRILCTSVSLKEQYEEVGIPADYIEDSPEQFNPAVHGKDGDRLSCYWFGDGSPGRWNDVVVLKEMIEKDPQLREWRFVTVSNNPAADMQWKSDSLNTISKADLVAIPVFKENETNRVKSANRLLQSMALSLPVICSPLRSYTGVASSWHDSVVCATKSEWRDALIKLKDDQLRMELAKNAFITAKKYDLETYIEKWIRHFEINDQFKQAFAGQREKMQRRVQKFFFECLLRKNLNYWNWRRFTLCGGLRFIYFKYLKAKSKLRSGHISFWSR
jgi:hypothetical protein